MENQQRPCVLCDFRRLSEIRHNPDAKTNGLVVIGKTKKVADLNGRPVCVLCGRVGDVV